MHYIELYKMNTEIEIKPTVIYSSYTEAQKRATQKYRVANKDKVNERRKLYYQQRKTKDPEFLEYKRQKAREYYQRNKDNKNVKECISLIDTTCKAMDDKIIFEEPIIEPVKDVIEPVIEKVDKPRRTYKKAFKNIVTELVLEKLEEVKPAIEKEVIIEPVIVTKVTKPKTIKVKPTKKEKHSAEVVGIVHDGAILKLQINGEDFCFQHDPTKAIKAKRAKKTK